MDIVSGSIGESVNVTTVPIMPANMINSGMANFINFPAKTEPYKDDDNLFTEKKRLKN